MNNFQKHLGGLGSQMKMSQNVWNPGRKGYISAATRAQGSSGKNKNAVNSDCLLALFFFSCGIYSALVLIQLS